MSMHVLVVGGGIGGLALAQRLRRSGVSVAVYERDAAPASRPQGYRIHLDAEGHRALAECLPGNLFDLYVATSNQPPRNPQAVFYDHHFTQTGAAGARAGDLPPDRAPTAVNRLTLRQVLLSGLDDVVRWDHELVAFDEHKGGVLATFANGETARGDVLVAADGINSMIRERMLPHAEIHDTGVRAINGKTLVSAIPGGVPERLLNSFNGVHGPNFRTLALGVYQSRLPGADAVAELAPGTELDTVDDYLMWLQLAKVEDFPVAESELWTASPEQLCDVASQMLDGWDAELRRYVELAEPDATFPLAIRAVLPVPAWETGRVTIMGDAIHAMTPIGGRGGNTALQDAALLGEQLALADQHERDVLPAIAEYEARMREYGYLAVEQSLRQAAPSLGARSPYGPAPAGVPA